MGNIYDICVQDSHGGEVKMSEFKNKTLLIVNVASKCGLTPQYVGLQKIFDEFKDRNFLVTDGELEKHKKFLETIDDTIWKKYL